MYVLQIMSSMNSRRSCLVIADPWSRLLWHRWQSHAIMPSCAFKPIPLPCSCRLEWADTIVPSSAPQWTQDWPLARSRSFLERKAKDSTAPSKHSNYTGQHNGHYKGYKHVAQEHRHCSAIRFDGLEHSRLLVLRTYETTSYEHMRRITNASQSL